MMLALVLGCWLALRGSTWALTGTPVEWTESLTPAAFPQVVTAAAGVEAPVLAQSASQRDAANERSSYRPQRLAAPRVVSAARGGVAHHATPSAVAAGLLAVAAPSVAARPLANTARPAADALPSVTSPSAARPRLSLDAWLFLRQDGPPRAATALRPASLGASQAGVVVRYDLRLDAPAQADAYLRASKALVHGGEREVAAGVALRPVPQVPMTVHAEGRVTARADDVELRPAAFVTAGFHHRLAGMDAVAYAQAGYVGGTFGTAFADGQVVISRRIDRGGPARVRTGLGAWGGVQEDADRLDLGPAASVELELAGAPVRIEASYRHRVAGSAEPGSGFALTVATGF
nr:hypothetical protein [Porphyrobacter sp. GA68]